MKKNRGEWHTYRSSQILGTYHPSAILRMPDGETKALLRNQLKFDLQAAMHKLNGG